MVSLKETITEANCQALHAVVETGGNKYLCFTRVENQTLMLCCTDGCDVWRLELDADELEAHRDLANTNMDAYLSKLRSSFLEGNIAVSQIGVKINLNVGHGANSLDFELYEAKAVVRRSELQTLLFCLAEKTATLESDLEKAKATIGNLKTQKHTGAGGLLDLGDVKKSKTQPKAQTKQVGMSVINPSSRKRKAAKGVEFN